MCRRFIADNKDFSEKNIENAGIEKRFQNIDLDKCVSEIIKYLNNWEKQRINEINRENTLFFIKL